MKAFAGFGSQERFIPVPETFFSQALSALRTAEAVKVALYALWRLQADEPPVLTAAALTSPEAQACVGLDAADMERGLQAAVRAGVLLEASSQGQPFYLLNSPRGRLLLKSLQAGQWQPTARPDLPPQPRPSVYRLYEENIGPLTPLISEALREAETMYPPEWIAEAIQIAAERNVRRWNYIRAILARWKEEGHASQQDRQNHSETDSRYRKGRFADFIES